jgi:tetratricopeptide (TPR) repeat protein
MLVHLVEQAGTVVCRQSLLSSVWPHATVVENSVNQAVAAIRQALGDDPALPRYVVTVTGRGYCFAIEVTTEGPDDRDPETYQLYVAGWSALTRPGPASLKTAQRYLEQATARDPGFALALACLAETHLLLGSHGVCSPLVAFPQARAAALAALKADPSSAEAHAVLSQIVFQYDYDIARAATLMTRALELNPACFIAYRLLGAQMAAQGRHEEAVAAARRAQAIEPLAVNINGNIGMAHYNAGRFEDAIVQLEYALRMDDTWVVAQSTLGRSYLCLGQFDRALKYFEGDGGARRGRVPDLALAYALAGRPDDARRELARLAQRPEGEYIAPLHFVMIHTALGNHDAALEWVEQVIEERANAGHLVIEPLLRNLRGDPRFVQRLKQIGLGVLLDGRCP